MNISNLFFQKKAPKKKKPVEIVFHVPKIKYSEEDERRIAEEKKDYDKVMAKQEKIREAIKLGQFDKILEEDQEEDDEEEYDEWLKEQHKKNEAIMLKKANEILGKKEEEQVDQEERQVEGPEEEEEEPTKNPPVFLNIKKDFDRNTFLTKILKKKDKKKEPIVIVNKEVEIPEVENSPILENILEEEEEVPKEVAEPIKKIKLKEIEEMEIVKIKKPRKKKLETEAKELGEDMKKRFKIVPSFELNVPGYYLNNRKIFIQFINNLFKPYKKELESESSQITCADIGKESTKDFSLLFHQKIIRDYMNLYTPYRGLLLYHGLGSGKTCTSIAIAEGFKNSKKVIIMTPASLQKNYMEQLKECGDYLYKKNQYWEWIPLTDNIQQLKEASLGLNLDYAFVKKQKGVWLVDVSKESNYNTLNIVEKEKLNLQIEQMIIKKYHFINYNGIRKENMRNMTNNFTTNLFDNTVVIIDEGHNLISRIVNKINSLPKKTKEGIIDFEKLPLSLIMYELLLTAKNVRIVILSGTPLINYPNELGILFNILRGYIKTWNFELKTTNKTDTQSFRQLFIKEKNLDYLDYNSSSKILSITKTPFDFYDIVNKRTEEYEGVSNLQKMKIKKEMSDGDFEESIKRILHSNDITYSLKDNNIVNYKCLPDRLDEFIYLFLDETFTEKTIKNSEMLKKRIMGLTSYFKSAQEELLPKYEKKEDFTILNIPMSDYQFTLYEKERQKERKQEKFKKQHKVEDLYKDASSTYRIFSRLFCNFVMPESFPRPFPMKKNREEEEEEEEEEPKKQKEPLQLKEQKKRVKCPNGTKKNKQGECVDKQGNIVYKNPPMEQEPIKIAKKEVEVEDQIKKTIEEVEDQIKKEIKKQKKIDEKEAQEHVEEVEEEVEEEEVEEEEVEEEEEAVEDKKKKRCPKGTRKNKNGDCVDKDGNIVKTEGKKLTANKTKKIKATFDLTGITKEPAQQLNPVETLPNNYGIHNPVNMCWLISTVQLLYHIPEFRQCILQNKEFFNDRKYKKAYESLKDIFKNFQQSLKTKKAIHAHQMKKSEYTELSDIIFSGRNYFGKQMDAHEAINNIISIFVPDARKEPVLLNCQGRPIYQLFAFTSKQITYCKLRQKITNEETNALNNKNIMLFLPYSKKFSSLQKSIEHYLSIHELDTKLDRCNAKDKSFEKINIFANSNLYFLINLGRQDNYGVKKDYSIEINKELSFMNERELEIKYGLFGVICHLGSDNSGHYTFAAYDDNSNFLYNYSDSDFPSKKEPNISKYATVLIYKRKELPTEALPIIIEKKEEDESELRKLVDRSDKIVSDDLAKTEQDMGPYIEGGMEEEAEEKEDIFDEENFEKDILEDDPNDEDNVLNQMGDETYEQRIQDALNYLKEHEKKYLSIKGLNIYSPKYKAMLENIINPEYIGLHLIYSQFRTLEGIGIFTLVLDANGFAPFRLKKNAAGKWEIKEKANEIGKLKYALYTGKEGADEKELVRKIYNGEWNNIPSNLKEQLLKKASNNRLGEIIKCFMITASGSEGINLQNTRFVHLMEPYWNPVRTDQVIGRARRICSHQYLPEELRTVQVFLYLMSFTQKQLDNEISNELKKKDLSKRDNKTPITSDQTLFEISLEKEIINNQLYKCVKETSIDCMIYSKANKKEGLVCLNFGNPSVNDFSYKPDYKKEENDVEAKINQHTLDLKVRKFTYKGKSYALNEQTGDILEEDNYTNIIGRMLRNPQGKLVPSFF